MFRTVTFRTTTANRRLHKAAATLVRGNNGSAVLTLRRGLLRKRHVELLDELTQAACQSCPLHISDALHPPVIFLDTDSTGILRWISPSVRPMLGYFPHELIGRYFPLLDQKTAAGARHRIARALASPVGEASFSYEYPVRHKDGRQIWMHSVTIHREGGRATVVLQESTHPVESTDWDNLVAQWENEDTETLITRRRKSDYQNALPTQLYATTNAGLILWVSPTIRPLLGYTPDEIAGRSVYNLIAAEDHPRIRDRIGSNDQRKTGQGAPPIRLSMLTKDGRRRQMEWISIRQSNGLNTAIGTPVDAEDESRAMPAKTSAE